MDKVDLVARDGGHVYMETNFNHFVVEPYNAMSALLFFAMGAFWFWKLRGQYEQFKFLTWATVFLTIGAIGGTVYHAFRMHAFFMYMDWLPILILCFMTSVYFIDKLLGSWLYALGVVAGGVLVQGLLFSFIKYPFAVSLSYAFMGVLVLAPTVALLVKKGFARWWFILYALGGFSLALFFRIADHWQILPMGTHFLWHLFGALAGNYMFLFIYHLNKDEIKNPC